MPSLTIFIGLAIALVFYSSHTPPDDFEKIAPELLSTRIPTDVLIRFRQSTPDAVTSGSKTARGQSVYARLLEQAQHTQHGALAYLKSQDIPYRQYIIANAIAARLTTTQMLALTQYDDVRRIMPDAPSKLEIPRYTGADMRSVTPEWGLLRIGADSVWSMGIDGSGVVVGGEDTGYEWTHPAIREKYRGWDGDTAIHDYHWHDAIHEISPLNNDSIVDPLNNPCGLDLREPCDDNGHGTHTMGTMVGSDSMNMIGVAPGAKWIACRNMERGYGKPSSYIECLEWFLAPTDLDGQNPNPALAPHVINNSWSCPELEGCNPDNWQLLAIAISNLKAAGVVVVTSAGNSGPQCSSVDRPPGMFAPSFVIGATNMQDTIANFSARGPVTIDSSGLIKPDVVAPGVGVRSAWLNSIYINANGTSMSAPHVAGTVALMISANPDLAGQVEVIEGILRATAVPLVTEQECGGLKDQDIPNNTYGYGRINALAAVRAAMQLTSAGEVEHLDTKLLVFPNPANNTAHIEYSGENQSPMLQIISMNGQIVLRTTLHRGVNTIDTQHLPNGVYVVQLRERSALSFDRLAISHH